MWILEEGQILPYLRSHYPVFDQSGPVDIQCIGALEGEEKPREPDEGGLINYIFRVSNGKQSVIVKQGRSASRKNDKIVLPIWRNRQEYETLRLRPVSYTHLETASKTAKKGAERCPSVHKAACGGLFRIAAGFIRPDPRQQSDNDTPVQPQPRVIPGSSNGGSSERSSEG